MARPSSVLTRAETVARLRALARTRGSVTFAWLDRNDAPTLRGALVHFESLARARRAAGMKAPQFPSRWSVDRVIEELRAAYDAGNSTKGVDLIEAGHGALLSAIAHRMGGLRRARDLAGIPHPKRRSPEYDPWDERRVLREIRDRWSDGEPLAASKAPRRLVNAGQRLFENWGDAITKAGLDYDQIRLQRVPYTEEDITRLLRNLARTHPDLTWGELHEHRAAGAMARIFGSVQRAVDAAGSTGWPIRRHAAWGRDAVLRALQTRARRDPRSPLPADLDDACRTYFGTVVAARVAAGVPPLRTSWSKELVIERLRAQAPQGQKLDANLRATSIRYFGSIRAARRAAGQVPRPTKWTRARVLEVLRDRARAGDIFIDGPLGDACSRLFGSRVAARKAAGIASPRTPMVRWSRASLLDELRRRVRSGLPLYAVGSACRRRFGNLAAARQLAGLPAVRPLWSKPRLIEALRACGGRPTTAALASACSTWFGSMNAARRVAGLPVRLTPQWTRKKVLAAVRRWAKAGQPALDSGLAHAVRRHLGSLEAACAAAGVVPRIQHWSQDRVKQALRSAERQGGKITTALALACRRYFGSIITARQAAGVALPRQRWTHADVVAALRARARRGLGSPGSRLAAACMRHFGSVSAAKRAAGVAAAQRTWTKASILSELRRRWRNTALTDGGLAGACRLHFGSVVAARKAAGLTPRQRSWTRALVIADVRRCARAGQPFPATLSYACAMYFGSIPAARRAAGVTTRRAGRRK